MGTSSPSGGPKGSTPLVPSWLEPGANGGGLDPQVPDGSPILVPPSSIPALPPGASPTPPGAAPLSPLPNQTVPVPLPPPPFRPALPPLGARDRFTSARRNFSRSAKSGGADGRSLKRAVSHYVSKATGGASGAARRMGAANSAGAGLLGFLNDVRTNGEAVALRRFNLSALAGRPLEDIFLGLADCVCSTGGRLDSSLARDAFIETIAELAANGITQLNSLTAEQMQTVFELYATHAIEARICNDIGTKAVSLPRDLSDVHEFQVQLRDFIRRGVADALTLANAEFQILTTETVLKFVEGVYETAFGILQTMGETEGESE